MAQENRAKIINIFIFEGEPITVFRLHYLRDVVDLFLLIESRHNMLGAGKKNLQVDLYRDQLMPFEMAGILVQEIVNISVSHRRGWAHEKRLRDWGKRVALKYMGTQDFLLIVSDADELPRKDIINNMANNFNEFKSGIHYLELHEFQYSFKWHSKDRVSDAYVISSDELKRSSNTSLSYLRYNSKKAVIIKNAGWHCRYFFDPLQLWDKLQSSSLAPHPSFNSPVTGMSNYTILNESWIRTCILNGIDFRSSTANRKLFLYDGSYGYPNCTECPLIPQYQRFNIP